MLERMLDFEREAFLFLNGLHTPYWDQVFWLYSGKAVWIPLAVFMLVVLAWRKPWREVLFLLVQTVNGYRGGLYGFISSHAANSFGLAMLLTLILRDKFLSASLFFWAAVNSYSRIYLGVHFLTDIVPGAISGVFFGFVVYRLYGLVRPSLGYSRRRLALLTGGIWVTICGILLYPLFVL